MSVAVLYVRPEDARTLDFSSTDLSEVSVTTVGTEAAALDALTASAFDCVVAHQRLDEGTGIDVLAAVRPERPTLPFVLCSDDPDGELASEATRHDVSAYHVLGGDETVEARVEELLDEAAAGDGEGPPTVLSDGAALTHDTAFSTIADTLNAAVVTIDTDSTIHFANDALGSLTGYDQSDLDGESFTKLMPERFRDAHQAAVDEYAATRERTLDWDYIELAVQHREGHEIPVAVSFSEFERDGELFFTGVVRDLRSRKSQERALRQLHEVASDPTLDTMEKIRRVVDDHRERLGLSLGFLSRLEDGSETLLAAVGDHEYAEEGLSLPLDQTYCQHTVEQNGPVVVTDSGEAATLDRSVYEQTGLSCYIGKTVTVDGDPWGILCFADQAAADEEFDDADIAFLEVLSDWVGYEIQQRQQRDRMREYTDSLSEMLAKTRQLAVEETPEAVARTVLEAAADVLGCSIGGVRRYDPETGVLRPIAISTEATDAIGPRPVYEAGAWGPGEALTSGETVVYEGPAERAAATDDGPDPASMAGVESVMFVPVGDDSVLSLGTTDEEGFDEQTQSLAELLASHAALAFERVERERELRTYETVLESLQGKVYAMDTDGTLSLVTDPLATWLGYDRAELVGSEPDVVMDAEEVERFRAGLRNLRQTDDESVTLETELVAADGRRLPAEIEISAATDGGFEGTIGVVRDLSELRATRQQLETERDRFSYLFDNIPDAVVDVVLDDGKPVVEETNEAFEEVFGYDSDRVSGDPIDDYLLPDSRASDRSDVYDTIAEMEQLSDEIRRETDDGLRYFLFRGIPYQESDGTLHGFGIYTDITERRQRSRRLQVLTRVLRHNLRNDLSILLGYAEMLRDGVEDERLREIATSVCDCIHDVSDLSEEVRAIQEILGEESDQQVMEAVGYLHRIVAECHEDVPEATVDVDVPTGLSLRVDERLDLVVRNLVENALEHAGENPHVDVSARADGDTLVLTVADDGPGIPDLEWNVVTGQTEITQLSHGSGLGLWAVKWVTDSYGGQIHRRDSALGGSEVELRLPGLVTA